MPKKTKSQISSQNKKADTHNEKPNGLRLVISNPSPAPESPASPLPQQNQEFSCEIRMRSPFLYTLVARDKKHYLNCELTLELERNDPNSLSVICHFTPIDDEALHHFVLEDENLLGMILIHFQMKLLQQLLSFCDEQNASELIIRIDEGEEEAFGIYQEVVSYADKVPGKDGQVTEIVISTNSETLDHWAKFMNEVSQSFRQTLWRDQRTNHAIQAYLKFNSCMDAFN